MSGPYQCWRWHFSEIRWHKSVSSIGLFFPFSSRDSWKHPEDFSRVDTSIPEKLCSSQEEMGTKYDVEPGCREKDLRGPSLCTMRLPEQGNAQEAALDDLASLAYNESTTSE